MAGDLNLTERLSILGNSAALAAPTGTRPMRFVHRYGDKVLIGLEPSRVMPGVADDALAERSAAAARVAGLSEVERLGVAAFQRRLDPQYKRAKQNRPRDGQPWDMEGCTQSLPDEAAGAMEALAAAPTSAYLEGSVAVGIIIVEGPTADLRFSDTERTQVVAEVQNGLTWLAAQNPFAGITFTYDIRVVTLTVPPNPGAADLEALWRDPAMAALGYTADWDGVIRYVEDNRTRFQTRWTYCAFFTKYPLRHFAYASIGGPRLVMDYANDGWGPDNIDRVFTHETGHHFQLP